jgi:hypothetical protein
MLRIVVAIKDITQNAAVSRGGFQNWHCGRILCIFWVRRNSSKEIINFEVIRVSFCGFNFTPKKNIQKSYKINQYHVNLPQN